MSYDTFPTSAKWLGDFKSAILDSMGHELFTVSGPRDWGEKVSTYLNLGKLVVDEQERMDRESQ